MSQDREGGRGAGLGVDGDELDTHAALLHLGDFQVARHDAPPLNLELGGIVQCRAIEKAPLGRTRHS
jgi:hypothetical protein